jgi:RNA polymerase sigma-70 factor (ECF subfamily)
LAKRAAAGDRGAFNAIVDCYAPVLFRVARALTRSSADAEDVVQEAFLAAYRGIGRYDGRSSLKTWLSKITMKRAISAWRKNKRHQASVPLESAPDMPGRNGQWGGDGSAAAAVDQKLDLAVILRTLAPEYREIFILREIEGLSYAEIAQRLAIPPGTVDSRLHRARGELRKKLHAYRK